MKMRLYSFIIAGLLLVLIVTPVLAVDTIDPGYTVSPRILAGQTEFAGVLKVTGNADGSITLDYMLRGGAGWCMTETQIHMGTSLSDFPQNNGGAISGQFDYKYEFDTCITDWSITIPTDFHGQLVYIAVHVDVIGPDGEETGWVVNCGNLEGGQFPGNNWSAYFQLPRNAWY
jgi:hypothetical protein